ncbi:MAG: Hint domain-containing protein [Pseudomonadota bacterium]
MTDIALYDDTTSPVDATNDATDTVSIYVTPSWVADGVPTVIQVDAGDDVVMDFAGEIGGTYTSRALGDYIYEISYFIDGSEYTNSLLISGGPGSVINNICFTRGARVATPSGPVAIEDLQAGDLVLTRDHGAQAIRWIGASKVSAETLAQFPALRPVTIAAGTFGDNAETTVSPAHRVLVDGWRAEALFGEGEVLATAASLVNDTTIRRVEASEVEYFHMMFDAHELVLVDGLWSESFHPAAVNATLAPATRDEVLELFPELEADAAVPAARRSVDASVMLIGV